MVFGEQSISDAGQTPQDIIFDVDTMGFEDKVMRASMSTPVIVDFWAPWCGPCKQLMPVLEKLVMEAKGQVRLAKVNLDENPELAQALRVQSVPAVFAFFQGQPVNAFMGAQPESQIKEFIGKLIAMVNGAQPDAIDIPEALKAAATALADKDLQMAQGIYMQVLQQDEQNAAAYTGLIRCLIAAGQVDDAQSMLDNAPDVIANSSEIEQARAAVEMASVKDTGDTADLRKRIEKNPDDHEAYIRLAMILFGADKKEEATDMLLASIERDRMYNEEEARQELLKLFKAMGASDPVTLSARRKLSSLLFS